MNEWSARKPESDQSQGPAEIYRVCDIRRETAEAVSVFLEPTSPSSYRHRFQAGQYLNLSFDIGQQTCVRCYSLSNAPHENTLRITVKRIQKGLVSSFITSGLQVGTSVTGIGVHGAFTIQNPCRDFLGVAAGSGITPVISMLKHMLRRSAAVCRLLYVTPDRDSAIFYDELANLVREYSGRLVVHHWHTRKEGRLRDLQLERCLTELAGEHEPDVYLCGPEAWMNQVRAAVRQNPERFGECYQELFVSGSSLSSPQSGGSNYHEVVLENAGKSYRLSVAESQTILAGAKAAGVDIPFGCEQGKCGCCMANCKSGEVDPGDTGFLTEAELEHGYILCCQAKPRSPCVVLTEG